MRVRAGLFALNVHEPGVEGNFANLGIELRTWVKDSIVLLGDASHPSLPYQAQGAAMAVEDGLVLGLLLGKVQSSGRIPEQERRAHLNSVLRLFESLRKQRTTTNVKGSIANRRMCKLSLK